MYFENSISADQFDAALQSAFEEKERLARHAYDKALSVRDFKNYIKEQHPAKGIDLTDLPPVNELREMKPKKLVKLWNKAKARFDAGQKQTSTYENVLENLGTILSEHDKVPEKGKKRFQDWTR